MFKNSKISDVRKSSLDLIANHANRARRLNIDQLQLIEETSLLSLSEKIDLLQISLNQKYTTEIFLNITYDYNFSLDILLPNIDDIEKMSKLINLLPFDFHLDSIIKKSPLYNCNEQIIWFQTSANKKIDKLMQSYSDTLSSLELGILYGYPATAAMAFEGFFEMPDKHKKSLYAFAVGAGRPSVEFYDNEEEQYKCQFEEIKKLSPKIIKEIEAEYEKFNSSHEKYWLEWDSEYKKKRRGNPPIINANSK